MAPEHILGISAFYHDAAACLLRDGRIVAAAQEERFTRRKFDPGFPARAIAYCLSEGGIAAGDLDQVVFYEKPWIHFERLLETYLAYAPRGLRSYLQAMSAWLGEKLFMRRVIRKALGWTGEVLFCEHHESHMAAAFYPSPFEEAAVLTVDGVGEWATACWGTGRANRLEVGGGLQFPHSLGLLYSAFTYYLGFKINSGEYKVMGLAPYGKPRYRDCILDELVDLRDDGSFRLDLDYFSYPYALRSTNQRFHRLFGGPPRRPESELTRRHMDIARSLQAVTEEILLRMARHVQRRTGQRRLVMAGGVALNCVANGRILREGPFDDIWIQPAAGDAGGALGCALAAWHRYLDRPRTVAPGRDGMQGAYLGPWFDPDAIRAYLDLIGACYHRLDPDAVAETAAALIADEKVVGIFDGRMEYGPRALGNRSILGDPRSPRMQSTINLKIKYRESFRPFAPAVLAERLSDLFELDRPTPYMLLVAPVHPAHRREIPPEEQKSGLARLGVPRSDIPAVTHVDDSARIQSVDGVHNRRFHEIIKAFERRTGVGCVINTSFNVRGEPIVCTPEDAYRCFMHTGMDHLFMHDLLLHKDEQPARDRLPRRAPATPPPPGKDKGRELGLVFAAVLCLAALWGVWREGWEVDTTRAVLLACAGGLVLCGLAVPGLLVPAWRAWMGFARLLSRVISPIVLTAFYLVVMLPVGGLRRLFGADPMGRRPAPPGASYWREHQDDGRGPERYTQQF